MSHLLLRILLWVGPITVIQAQTSVIKGTVRLEDNTPAIGAVVELQPSGVRTISDTDGAFLLENVPAKEYRLQVNFLGAVPYQATLVVAPGQEILLNIQLKNTSSTLNEVLVTGQSAASAQADQALQIESIEIRELTTRIKDISEALDQVSGVNVRGTGSFGDRVDISINGLNGTAVRTYIDDLPLEFVYPGFDIGNIPVDGVERIDVYKGVMPINIGSDALGGGVNIITRQKDYNELRASYGYGSFNTHQAAVSGNWMIGNGVGLSGNVAYNYSDNNYTMQAYVWEEQEVQEVERFHDAYELFFTGLSLNVSQKKWADRFRLSAHLTTYDKELQNGGIVTNFPIGDARYSGQGNVFSLQYAKTLGSKLEFQLYASYSNTDQIWVDTTANIYSWSGDIISRNESNRGEFDRAALTDRNFANYVNRSNIIYRISDKDELLLSNLYAHQTTQGRDETRDLEKDPLREPQFLTKNMLGLQYQRRLFSDKLTLAAAAKRYAFNLQGIESRSFTEVSKNDHQLGYYGSAKYDLTKRMFVRASYEKALRVPTFYQFFGNGASILSNVELIPETSDNYNIGWAFRNKAGGTLRYRLEINGFLRGQNDIIYLTNDQFQRYRNSEEVRTLGLEGEVSLTLWDRLQFTGNITRLRATYESIAAANTNAQFLVGTTFPNIPSLFSSARVSYEHIKLIQTDDRLQIYVQHKFVDKFNYINVGQIYDPKNYVPVQHTFHTGFTYSIAREKIKLAFNIVNLFDADIFDNYKVPRPGRSFNTKLIYQINNL